MGYWKRLTLANSTSNWTTFTKEFQFHIRILFLISFTVVCHAQQNILAITKVMPTAMPRTINLLPTMMPFVLKNSSIQPHASSRSVMSTSSHSQLSPNSTLLVKKSLSSVFKLPETISSQIDRTFSVFGGISHNPPSIVPKVTAYFGNPPKAYPLYVAEAPTKKIKKKKKKGRGWRRPSKYSSSSYGRNKGGYSSSYGRLSPSSSYGPPLGDPISHYDGPAGYSGNNYQPSWSSSGGYSSPASGGYSLTSGSQRGYPTSAYGTGGYALASYDNQNSNQLHSNQVNTQQYSPSNFGNLNQVLPLSAVQAPVTIFSPQPQPQVVLQPPSDPQTITTTNLSTPPQSFGNIGSTVQENISVTSNNAAFQVLTTTNNQQQQQPQTNLANNNVAVVQQQIPTSADLTSFTTIPAVTTIVPPQQQQQVFNNIQPQQLQKVFNNIQPQQQVSNNIQQQPIFTNTVQQQHQPIFTNTLQQQHQPIFTNTLQQQQQPIFTNTVQQQQPIFTNTVQQQQPIFTNTVQQQQPTFANTVQQQQQPIFTNTAQQQQQPIFTNTVQRQPTFTNNVQQQPIPTNNVQQLQQPLFTNSLQQQLFTNNVQHQPLFSNNNVQHQPLFSNNNVQHQPLFSNNNVQQQQPIFNNQQQLSNNQQRQFTTTDQQPIFANSNANSQFLTQQPPFQQQPVFSNNQFSTVQQQPMSNTQFSAQSVQQPIFTTSQFATQPQQQQPMVFSTFSSLQPQTQPTFQQQSTMVTNPNQVKFHFFVSPETQTNSVLSSVVPLVQPAPRQQTQQDVYYVIKKKQTHLIQPIHINLPSESAQPESYFLRYKNSYSSKAGNDDYLDQGGSSSLVNKPIATSITRIEHRSMSPPTSTEAPWKPIVSQGKVPDSEAIREGLQLALTSAYKSISEDYKY